MESNPCCASCGGALTKREDGSLCEACGRTDPDGTEAARRDGIYQKAVVSMRGIKNPDLQQRAIDLFRSIPGWRDADERIAVCERRIREIREKAEADRLAAELAAKKRRRTTTE